MTNIYALSSDMNRFEWFQPIDADGRDILVCRNGKPESVPNGPIPVSIGGHEGEESDCPGLYHSAPCLSERAWCCLRPLIDADVQAIPVYRTDGVVFHAINVLKVIDCLNREKSRYSVLPDVGWISWIYEYDFDIIKINDSPIFKIPETVGLEVYVSDVFKNAVETHLLTGFRFRRIYRTE
jgi:hypothetical protein